MRISDTISRLAAVRAPAGAWGSGGPGRLSELAGFGSNPGTLAAWTYIPDDLPAGAPLVVVLHGCTQSAAGYDDGSGWSALADAQGFAVLFPEQRRTNNGNLCFNWFVPGDIRRGAGEALSIRQMVAAMVKAHGIDPARIFVTGLSAGGAMTSVMLATYPEVFAGGAIIAGLPYGCAANVSEALARMRAARGRPAAVRDASNHDGPWPVVSVWHGSADHIVDRSNAAAIVEQWLPVHGLGGAPAEASEVDGARRETWRDARGRAVIENYSIAGMGHGTPLKTGGQDGLGQSGPHMIEAGISSTRHIAASGALRRRWRANAFPPSPSSSA